MNRKYFFFDIDGTLLVGNPGSQYLPESTRRTLETLKRNGHFVAIATGRSAPMAVGIMNDLDLHNMVHDGGNGLTINDQLIECRPLDRDKCVALADECDAKGIAWAFSPENSTLRVSRDQRFQSETHDVYMKTTMFPDLDIHTYPLIYKMYIACKPGVENQLTSLQHLPWCRYGDSYFFVEPIDKSIGIKRMIDLLDGKAEDVVVFGDAGNDLSMFLPEWTSIAMGNAVEELKAIADYVTTDVDKDGIYNACVHYGWIDPFI